MKKQVILGLVIGLLVCTAVSVSAEGALSPAIRVMQTDAAVQKTGVGRNSVSFCEEDFAAVLGENGAAIRVTSLPAVAAGVLKLGAVGVVPGQWIAREALSALRFVPSGEEKTAQFSFAPDGGYYDEPFVCTVSLLDALNFAPTAKDVSLSAMNGVSAFGTLAATDPDGDAMTFRVLTAPKKGSVKLTDAASGTFRYTADADAHGKDVFTYAAVDCYGNVSATATVRVDTEENGAGFLYADLGQSAWQAPAVALAADGILVGETIGSEHFFYPEKAVSRGEFLMMAMKAAGIAPVTGAESSFADRAEFSATEKRYIETAEALGYVVGMETERGRCFCPSRTITASQAATILGRISEKSAAFADACLVSATDEAEISDEAYALMAAAGIALPTDRSTPLSRADAAKLLVSVRKD